MSGFDFEAHRLAAVEETLHLYRRLNDGVSVESMRESLQGAPINNIIVARVLMEKELKLAPETTTAVKELIGTKKAVFAAPKSPLTFEDLEAAAKTIGITDVRNILNTFAHQSKWFDKHGEQPATEIAGQQEQHRRYRAAEDGLGAAPPYLDLWHWLLAYTRFSERSLTTNSKHSLTVTIRAVDLKHQPGWAKLVMEHLLEPFGGEITLLMEVSR